MHCLRSVCEDCVMRLGRVQSGCNQILGYNIEGIHSRMSDKKVKKSVTIAEPEIVEVVGDTDDLVEVPRRPRSRRDKSPLTLPRKEEAEEEEDDEDYSDYSEDEDSEDDGEYDDPLVDALAEVLISQDGFTVAESLKSIAVSLTELLQLFGTTFEKQAKQAKIQSKLLQILAECTTGTTTAPPCESNAQDTCAESTAALDTTNP
jgi:hypothetical protein